MSNDKQVFFSHGDKKTANRSCFYFAEEKNYTVLKITPLTIAPDQVDKMNPEELKKLCKELMEDRNELAQRIYEHDHAAKSMDERCCWGTYD